MFPFKFSCNNQIEDPLLKQLHSIYHATPFLPPSAGDIELLHLVAHRGEKTFRMGPLQEVLKEGGAESLSSLGSGEAQVASVALNQSSKFNMDLGFKLLEGLFKGFDLKMEPFKAALNGERELSLSFQQVIRRHIHHTAMGSAFRSLHVDMEHPSIKATHRRMGLFVVSSLLQSCQFTLQLEKSKNGTFDLEAPSIDAIAEAGLKVGGDGERELSFTYTGKKPLTFAFSCYELKLDIAGKLQIEQEVSWRKGFEAEEKDALGEGNPEVSFISPRLPAILAWDEA